MVFSDIFDRYERAELYRLFAGLFLHEPYEDFILHMRELFFMTFNDTIDEIRMDFSRLFVKSRDLLPLGSIQREYALPRELLIKDIEELYHSTGIMLDEEMNLPADHLSVELIFLSYTVENDLYQVFSKFFEEHIITWVPEYCDRIIQHSQTSFYKEAISVFKEFIETEYDELMNP